MLHREALRWLGSIGIFYVAIPIWVLWSGPLWARVLPMLPEADFGGPSRIWPWLLVAAGVILATLSMAQMVVQGGGHPFDLTGHERLSRPTRRLMTRGVYAWTRNPMGLGDVLLYAGLAGVAGSLPSLLVNVPAYTGLVWWNHRFHERPGLIERFGDEWLAYERSTSWLVPGWRTWRGRRCD